MVEPHWVEPGERKRMRRRAVALGVVGVLILGALFLYAAPRLWDRFWPASVPTAPMGGVRQGHTATLLPGGQVLVVGGAEDFDSVLSTAERYDPTTNTWRPAGAMMVGRAGHTAALLPGGRVLIVGGHGTQRGGVLSGTLMAAELYDPVTDAWRAVAPLSTGRAGHTATLLPDGRVLVAGGRTGDYHYLATAELYDPATDRWQPAGAMAVGREDHTATLLPDGRVLAAGGIGGSEDPRSARFLAAAEVYDPTMNGWRPATALATRRQRHSATLLPNGQVLVIGGIGGGEGTRGGEILATAERYDPATDRWWPPGRLAHSLASTHEATLLSDGQVLVTSGSEAQRYDPATDRWRDAEQTLRSRSRCTATLLPNGRVLLAGGSLQVTAEVYHPQRRNPFGGWR